ncbi:MAG: Lrp/AsnC family transcriptional regulator [Bacteroidetes bacterium]|nr:Lrp/AsnC family transcriptional regulator [Bacteroidota bacterium]
MTSKSGSIDLKILQILQENARISITELAEKIGLSPAPTLARIKKLEETGAIKGYRTIIDPVAAGLGIQAIIEIALTHQVKDSINRFKEEVNKIDEITECHQVTGNVDFVVKAMVKDIAAYEKMISEKLSKLEIISNMRTRVILATTKTTIVLPGNYSLPVNAKEKEVIQEEKNPDHENKVTD